MSGGGHKHPIPTDIERFIVASIDSVAEIEALLLMRHTTPQLWDAESLARRLYIDASQTAETLKQLATKKLVVESQTDGAYRYEPQTDELRGLIDRLAEIYSMHLVPVTNLIHNKPKSQVQEFADAFRVRKEE
jgi:hypothetical protein